MNRWLVLGQRPGRLVLRSKGSELDLGGTLIVRALVLSVVFGVGIAANVPGDGKAKSARDRMRCSGHDVPVTILTTIDRNTGDSILGADYGRRSGSEGGNAGEDDGGPHGGQRCRVLVAGMRIDVGMDA
jgi:hypothetical protein